MQPQQDVDKEVGWAAVVGLWDIAIEVIAGESVTQPEDSDGQPRQEPSPKERRSSS